MVVMVDEELSDCIVFIIWTLMGALKCLECSEILTKIFLSIVDLI